MKTSLLHNLGLYLKIKGLSSLRLAREIPFVYILLILSGLIVGFLFMIKLPVNNSFSTVSISIILYALIGIRFFSIREKEFVLLKSLNISIYTVNFIRYALWAAVFFLLTVRIGLLALLLACILPLFDKTVKFSNPTIPSFYKKSAYQWLSAFRQSILWIFIFGGLMVIISLFYSNLNMLYVAMGILICLPCFFSFYLTGDDGSWLRVYKNTSKLLKIKLFELMIHSLIPAIVLFPFALFLSPFFPLLQMEIIFITVNILIFYSFYLGFPHVLSSYILNAFFVSVSVFLWQIIAFYAIIPTVLLICILHIILSYHLNGLLHVKTEIKN
ncbi:MAG: hypothetical protein LBE91_01065 [Tannerella sp.]|jgi:hypothetical protein|nr:hypothetical protein [Tannerella sp.]